MEAWPSAPKADLKHLDRSQFGRPLSEMAINPPLDKLAEWYPYRLVVKRGSDDVVHQRPQGERDTRCRPTSTPGWPWSA